MNRAWSQYKQATPVPTWVEGEGKGGSWVPFDVPRNRLELRELLKRDPELRAVRKGVFGAWRRDQPAVQED